MKIAIYPGSFDPITLGHMDILNRALEIFDKVIVLIADNPDKESRFTIKERLDMVKSAVKDLKKVEVDYSSGLTVKYAKEHNAKHLIRGLRAVSDFEYEFALASANEFIDSDIDMVFFMSRGDKNFISSSMIVTLYNQGVDVTHLVPISVVEHLKKLNK